MVRSNAHGPTERLALVDFFDRLCEGAGGMMLAANFVKVNENAAFRDMAGVLREYTQECVYTDMGFDKAINDVVVAPSFLSAVRSMLVSGGVGKLKPNLLAFGFRESWNAAPLSDDPASIEEHHLRTYQYVQGIRDALFFKCAVAILRNWGKGMSADDVLEELQIMELEDSKRALKNHKRASSRTPVERASGQSFARVARALPKGYIDVWWLDDSGGLCLLLPFVMCKTKVWSQCKLRVFVRKSSKITAAEQTERVAELLRKVRIRAHEINVIDIPEAGNSARTEEHARMIEEMKNELTEDEKKTLVSEFDLGEEAKVDASEEESNEGNDVKQISTGLENTWKVAPKWLAAKSGLGDEIQKYAGEDTRLVVIAMPFPRSEVGTTSLSLSHTHTPDSM